MLLLNGVVGSVKDGLELKETASSNSKTRLGRALSYRSGGWDSSLRIHERQSLELTGFYIE